MGIDRTGLAVMGLTFAAAASAVMTMALLMASPHIQGHWQLESGVVAMAR